jgi:hypothetical protein
VNKYELTAYAAAGLAITVSLAAFFSELSVALALLGAIAAAFLWLFKKEQHVAIPFDIDSWLNTKTTHSY